MTTERPSADELARLYREAGSRRELGRRLSISDMTASNWLKAAGVELNPPSLAPRSPWRNGIHGDWKEHLVVKP